MWPPFEGLFSNCRENIYKPWICIKNIFSERCTWFISTVSRSFQVSVCINSVRGSIVCFSQKHSFVSDSRGDPSPVIDRTTSIKRRAKLAEMNAYVRCRNEINLKLVFPGNSTRFIFQKLNYQQSECIRCFRKVNSSRVIITQGENKLSIIFGWPLLCRVRCSCI